MGTALRAIFPQASGLQRDHRRRPYRQKLGRRSSVPTRTPARKAFTVEIRPAELSRALTALHAYQTQMPALFAGEAERKLLYGTVPETI